MHAWEVELAKKLWFGEDLHTYVTKHAQNLRGLRNITLTSREQFAERVSAIKGRFRNSYWLSIIFDKNNTPKRFPQISNNVRVYNNMLRRIYRGNFIDLDEIVTGHFMEDSLHLESKGQELVFERMSEIVELELGKES